MCSLLAATAVGQGTLPIAVNLGKAKPNAVVEIVFNSDQEDNGGWFAIAPDSASASTFKDYIVNDSCPALKLGDTLSLQNGSVASALQVLKDELATHPGGWDVFLPAVDTPKFNHADQIDSFVSVRITEVKDTGDPKYVKGTILTLGEAQSAQPGPGNPGGVPTGALAPPKLVL